MSTTPLFPMFLKLAGRACLVVGAGRLGEQKIRGLIECGAQVRIVAPTATPAIAEAASSGALTWRQRIFKSSDLHGVFLVVAATSSAEVNHAIYEEAQQRGILCNVVDDPPHCDFFYPAVVRRGHFQIAISTGGLSPALAQRVRKQLEEEFPPVYSAWLEFLGRRRSALFHDVSNPELRRDLIHESVTPEAFAQFEREQLLGGAPGGDARHSAEVGTSRRAGTPDSPRSA
jgi:precorrin-2 dehydrogenase/sirohydrochlorin ferrochelatase